MALALYGNGIIELRGTVGGTVYSRGRGGATLRAKTSPTQWRSNARQVSKGKLSAISGNWSTQLSDADRAGWNSFALVTPSTNVYGQTTYLSGHQWYCRCNINLYSAGAAAITTAPASATVPGLTGLTLTAASGGGGSITLTGTAGVLPAFWKARLKATGPISPGIYYVNNLLKEIEFMVFAGLLETVTTPYTNLFPNIVNSAGRKIFAFVTILDTTTGIESPGIIASGIVT